MVTQALSPISKSRASGPAVAEATTGAYSLRQRLRSCYHAFWYHLGKEIYWSRGIYREHPVGHLADLSGNQQARIALLGRRFLVRFEQAAESLTSLRCYDYLDILDQAWSAWGLPRPIGGVVHDVGSSNFWYAPVLHSFFRPAELTGVEIAGHRLYSNCYSRRDYAHGYILDLPNTGFVIGDYARFEQPANVVTAWFPFVTPAPLLAWRLPLSLFSPAAIFRRIAGNLKPDGLFVMVNQGQEEASIAAGLCRQVGLELQHSCELPATIRIRPLPPVVSCWVATERAE